MRNRFGFRFGVQGQDRRHRPRFIGSRQSPSKFKHVFRRAHDAGFFLTAHAGEEGPPSYVWEALDVLGVGRIDHGNRSLQDQTLVGRLARERMALTVCPLSNLRLRVVPDLNCIRCGR